MRIYMGTDLEGVAGVVSFADQGYPDGRYYEAAKKLLTAEINAAVEGLISAGVEDVLVSDGHGPGAICFEDLHPAVRLIHGRPPAPREVRDPHIAACDACVMIGQHAMAGVATASMNHTQNSRAVDYYKLNDRPIGEIAQFALYQGALGLALVFLLGHNAACPEAENLIPCIATVAVKQGLSRGPAISLAASESRRLIGEGIAQAVAEHRRNPAAALVWEEPFVLEKRYFTSQDADQAASQPGAERLDSQTVCRRDSDIRQIIYR